MKKKFSSKVSNNITIMSLNSLPPFANSLRAICCELSFNGWLAFIKRFLSLSLACLVRHAWLFAFGRY